MGVITVITLWVHDRPPIRLGGDGCGRREGHQDVQLSDQSRAGLQDRDVGGRGLQSLLYDVRLLHSVCGLEVANPLADGPECRCCEVDAVLRGAGNGNVKQQLLKPRNVTGKRTFRVEVTPF